MSSLTATSLRIEHFSVFRVPSQSQRIRHTFAVSLSAFAVESPTSKNFSTGSKILQFAAQFPWSRTAASVGSQCIRHQIDGDCAANPRRLQYNSGECTEHRWSRGRKARGQGQGHKKNPRQRPRTAFPRTDTLEAKDRNAQGPGQGPRTQAQMLSKKKVFTKIFQAISTKKRFPKNFSGAPQNFNYSKNSAVLEPRTGQFSRT